MTLAPCKHCGGAAKIVKGITDAQPWPLSLAVFDAAVNCGVGKAQQWLQQSGGDFAAFNALRLEFYTGINGWGLYGNAWTRRVANLMRAK